MKDDGLLGTAYMKRINEVVERLSLRHVAADPATAFAKLSLDNPQVQEHAAVVMQRFSLFRNKEGIFTKGMVVHGAKTMPPSHRWRCLLDT